MNWKASKTASNKKQARTKRAERPKITIVRTYPATLEEVWDLWTTRAGLEQWWSPEEFFMRVRRLDLRPGGELEYAVTAIDSPEIEALKNAGRPITRINRCILTEVIPQKRISFKTSSDFIPGVKTYRFGTVVDFGLENNLVKMVMTQDAMHDSKWTQTLALNLERQANRLGRVILARREEEEKQAVPQANQLKDDVNPEKASPPP